MVVSDNSKGGRTPPLPAVDERLIMPETRYEVIDGEVVYVSPAEPPHAILHAKLSALLEAHAATGFGTASDMLTRTSEKGDMAPDGSVFPLAPDPETGGRQIEQLAFEVVSTESLAHAGRKAAALTARGVRRVFALDVERRRALEWSTATGAWQMLHPDGVVDDPALVVPLPVAALVGVGAEYAVANALLAKRNPILSQAIDEGEARGEARGRGDGVARALLQLLEARFGTLDAPARARVASADEPQCLAWIARAATATTLAAVWER